MEAAFMGAGEVEDVDERVLGFQGGNGPDERRVEGEGAFEVHGDGVDEARVERGLDDVRPKPVGVEF